MLDWERAPEAPLDVVAWLDERQRVWESQSEFWHPRGPWPERAPRRAAATEEHLRVRVALHRVVGPEALDAELRSAAPLVRDCYEHDEAGKVRVERLKLTLLERETAPVVIAATDRAMRPSRSLRA